MPALALVAVFVLDWTGVLDFFAGMRTSKNGRNRTGRTHKNRQKVAAGGHSGGFCRALRPPFAGKGGPASCVGDHLVCSPCGVPSGPRGAEVARGIPELPLSGGRPVPEVLLSRLRCVTLDYTGGALFKALMRSLTRL
ncbi:hypothetical protein FQZ97_1115550 [compost metagenome]